MSETEQEIHFEHDTEGEQFDAIVGKYRAYIRYRANREGKIFLTHTEADPELQGKGVAEKLVQYVFNYIEEQGMRMIPVCPYIKTYLKRHPEYMRIVASGIQLS